MLTGSNKPPSASFFSPLADAYTTKGTAPLGAADTGQNWFLVENPAASDARLSVIGGKLTNTRVTAGVAAGYATANVGKNVTRIGGKFTLSSASAVLAFCVWQRNLETPNFIPPTGCHVVVTPTGWSYGYPSVIASGSFNTALVTDGVTVSQFDIAISGSTATLTLPDGTQQQVTDASISALAGPYACFEVYQNNAATDGKSAFVSVYAV
jgi:hypothetical protein